MPQSPGGGEGLLEYTFAAGISDPLPQYYCLFYFVANYRPNLSQFWANQRNLRDLNLVTLCHILTKNLPILESLLTRILLPHNPESCYPVLVVLLKIQPHYSQSSRENATPSSGTSQLAYYKKVPYWTTIVKVASTRMVTLNLNDNLFVSEVMLLGISERNKLCRYSFLLAKHSGNS